MSDSQVKISPRTKNKLEWPIGRLWPTLSLFSPSLWDLPVFKFTCRIPGNPMIGSRCSRAPSRKSTDRDEPHRDFRIAVRIRFRGDGSRKVHGTTQTEISQRRRGAAPRHQAAD
jgi:hypothetical protein